MGGGWLAARSQVGSASGDGHGGDSGMTTAWAVSRAGRQERRRSLGIVSGDLGLPNFRQPKVTWKCKRPFPQFTARFGIEDSVVTSGSVNF